MLPWKGVVLPRPPGCCWLGVTSGCSGLCTPRTHCACTCCNHMFLTVEFWLRQTPAVRFLSPLGPWPRWAFPTLAPKPPRCAFHCPLAHGRPLALWHAAPRSALHCLACRGHAKTLATSTSWGRGPPSVCRSSSSLPPEHPLCKRPALSASPYEASANAWMMHVMTVIA